MERDEKTKLWERNEVNSPCKKICIIHRKSKLCIGCFRSAEEIKLWNWYSKETRNRLISELPDRESRAIPKKRSGRSNRISKILSK